MDNVGKALDDISKAHKQLSQRVEQQIPQDVSDTVPFALFDLIQLILTTQYRVLCLFVLDWRVAVKVGQLQVLDW